MWLHAETFVGTFGGPSLGRPLPPSKLMRPMCRCLGEDSSLFPPYSENEYLQLSGDRTRHFNFTRGNAEPLTQPTVQGRL
jgi:hypothetical protein